MYTIYNTISWQGFHALTPGIMMFEAKCKLQKSLSDALDFFNSQSKTPIFMVSETIKIGVFDWLLKNQVSRPSTPNQMDYFLRLLQFNFQEKLRMWTSDG